MIALKDLYWIAGLLEGEGWFANREHKGRLIGLNITVGMTDQDVIERVQSILGFGTILQRILPSGKVFFNWRSTNQAQTAGLMMTLLPLMGNRRREKIIESLVIWKERPLRYSLRTHCENGHEFSGDNLIIRYDGKYKKRRCRTCMAQRAAKYRAAKRLNPPFRRAVL